MGREDERPSPGILQAAYLHLGDIPLLHGQGQPHPRNGISGRDGGQATS